jgi:hypothetical protein
MTVPSVGAVPMISEFDVRSAIRPLRWIFWGALLWIIDLKINDFDLANDVLASILVLMGVSRLGQIDVSVRYRSMMWWVWLIAISSVPVTLVKTFGSNFGQPLSILMTIFSLAQLAATVAFCVAMRWFCGEAGLIRSAESWRLTSIFFITLFAGPLGLLYGYMLLSQLTGMRWTLNVGTSVVLILFVLLVPIVHFFISTSRMRREAAGGGTFTGQAFPVVPLADEPPIERPDE